MQAAAQAYWEQPATKKARRIGYHVVRGAKKFVFGTGNAAWVVGTTMLVMVMPLVFEIDREQQAVEWESQGIAK
jgi:import receptor subunit TOM22